MVAAAATRNALLVAGARYLTLPVLVHLPMSLGRAAV